MHLDHTLARAVRAALATTTLALAVAPAVHAEDGGWIVRAGASVVDPKKNNLALPGAELQVDKDTGVTFDLTKMFTKHWGLELLGATRFKHKLKLDTATGTVDFGSTQHLPPTLSLQYHFNPDGTVRPYVGAGVNYTMFSGEQPDGLVLDNSFGPAVGGGIDFGLPRNLLVNVAVKWIGIEPKARLGGADLGKVKINPLVYSLNVGWRFGGEAPPVAAAPVVAAAAPAAAPAPAPAPEPPPPPAKPLDSDGDGVPDDRDLCPGTPKGTRVGPAGCPCDLTAKLNFRTNSAELTDADRKTLDAVAAEMVRLHWISGVVEGHTDAVGSEAYNQKLSERRAATVRDYLAAKGIGDGRMQAVGYGESKPVADNATAAGRAENRRVVLRRTDCDQKP
jgi:outer membrane protein W/outer membrane protein OmpA-like peptidoglycan-associated protein